MIEIKTPCVNIWRRVLFVGKEKSKSMDTELRNRPIGVFDSGMGGVSVLRQLVRVMPGEDFLYYGDSAHAPYGTKPLQEIRELTIANVECLLEQGAKGIVVACNTATSAAVAKLRQMHPEVPLVGIEPAIKPAVLEHPGGRVVVMATPMTLRQEKFQKLMGRYEDKAQIVPLPCPGLMEFVERGETTGDNLRKYLTELLWSVQDQPIDAIVLGCTHYPFVQDMVVQVAGERVAIYDGACGTAREMRRRLRESRLLSDSEEQGKIEFQCSKADKEEEILFHKLLSL